MYFIDGLKKVKTLLNIDIEDNSKNYLIEEVLKTQAISMIKKYLNYGSCELDFIENNCEDALILCIVDLYHNLENKNGSIQSITQGQRSISYNTNSNTGLSDRVKSMLPLPRMRLL